MTSDVQVQPGGNTRASQQFQPQPLGTLVGSLLLASVGGLGPAAALGEASAALEEVIVTARKREESLQETPISLSVFNAAALQARSLTSLADIAAHTPNLEFTTSAPAGGSAGQAFIRGIGQLDFLITTDPGVGLYVDGVYLARTSGAILDLVDIERIEVLRGPQGTLYGKNTIGGAINIVTTRPADARQGRLDLTLGSYDRIDVRAVADLPLVAQTLSARLAVSSRNRDGYAHRVAFGSGVRVADLGNEDSLAWRGQLRWTPGARLEVLFAVDGTTEDRNMSARSVVAINEQAQLLGLLNAFDGPYDRRYLSGNPLVSFATGSNAIDLDVWGASVTATWAADGTTIRSITAYRELDSSFGNDPDGSPVVIIDESDVTSQQQFSQELQLTGTAFDSRLDWVVGLYYFQESADADLSVLVAPGVFNGLESLPGPVFCLPPPMPCLGGAGNSFNSFFDFGLRDLLGVDTDSYAAFGQGTYAITDQLSLTGGLRYTYEQKDYTIEMFHPLSGASVVPPSEVDESWDAFSPRLGVEYRWSAGLMTYLSAAHGFKSGGFNGRPTGTQGVQAYDPEFLWSYEAGFKSQWAGDRVRLNAAVFYNDYQDMQLTVVGSTPQGTPDVRVENAGQAEVSGAELELDFSPLPGLLLSLGVGYLDARFTETTPGAEVSTDSEFLEAPEWSVAAGAEYTWSLPAGNRLTMRADYTYKSKVYHDATNSDVIAQPGFGLARARVTWETAGGRWQLAIFGTNLTDERYTLSGVDSLGSLGFADAQFGPPREWGLQASYRF
ncbi:MAG: TonB-dependent receptor [Gammaproteobacteria bacterium]|nr:MAG: TonB-dependent receptor [Gammaproteobacteria bacterium]